uniref:ATP synthase subunit a n=1 Tax=Aleurochiton aceris TaxID=266942 RepID=Q697H6_ALEAC|nr:ATP synthase F0 subunit 6 [Aleurochiton aceris]
MLSSLFEIYDPYSFFMDLSLNWLLIILFLLFCFSKYWLMTSCYLIFDFKLINFLLYEFSMYFNMKLMKLFMVLFISLFGYLLIINLLGLMPYVFSSSSHFVFCLSFSFPLWMGTIFIGWVMMSNQMFAHLIPLGTPLILVSLMVLIETVSQLIRPWSLSIRLMANMISGHLLMNLLGDCNSSFFLLQTGLFMFEFFVCFIQAYVFCALLTLYYGDL